MNSELRAAWQLIEDARTNYLSLIESWSDDRLTQQPNGGWNALQVTEHLIISEYGTLQYLLKKTQTPAESLEPSDETSAEASRKLNLALKSDLKWEAPNVVTPPSGKHTLQVLVAQWDELRAGWVQLLSSIDESYMKRQVFRHPIAGRLDLLQTLSFLENHIHHHVHQIRRIANPE
jgi:hypothetical protein